jgi:hypothetical protein
MIPEECLSKTRLHGLGRVWYVGIGDGGMARHCTSM